MIPAHDYQYKGDDAKFNDTKLIQQLYMNSIDESGRRYDVTRHVKRTSKSFKNQYTYGKTLKKKKKTDKAKTSLDYFIKTHLATPTSFKPSYLKRAWWR